MLRDWPIFLIMFACLLCSACGPDIATTEPSYSLSITSGRSPHKSVVGMVARCPEDPDALEDSFNESTYLRSYIDSALTDLIADGTIVVTPKGVRLAEGFPFCRCGRELDLNR